MKALIASVLLIISFSSHSQEDGNDLLTGYKEYKSIMNKDDGEIYEAAKYVGFVNGATQRLIVSEFLCIPGSVRKAQIYDIIGKFLEGNPASRNWAGSTLIYMALIKPFECEE